ncbi:thioredoxin-like protein [Lasiosphaeria ovina]|uniref:Thioredoxin-like protein n=1 Tax=Lasiosphaeria ovina TaxID=92902 RepID=A0AAE0JVU8_9PEZI|nr:thioredoxin-like protein [Lasiosphaeria ovina]
MPSHRRVRLLFYAVLAAVVILLFFTSHLRRTSPQDTRTSRDFYHKTTDALEKTQGVMAGDGTLKPVERHDHDADGDIDEDDEIVAKAMADRLRAAEQKAKDIANAKAPNKPDPPSNVIGVGSSASGQKKTDDALKKQDGTTDTDESSDVAELDAEMDSIFAKSPVIIFSKSYCPYSARAKGVLMEKYLIEPKPFVVELDLHPLGPQIQARLLAMTDRKTVPNILVYGKSIGGGDEITALDNEKTLAAKIKSIAGKRVDVTERFVEDVQKTN